MTEIGPDYQKPKSAAEAIEQVARFISGDQ